MAEKHLQGKKTHEQQLRILEGKPDIPDGRNLDTEAGAGGAGAHVAKQGVRDSEFPVSRGGFNQESSHNKHNHQGQQGHKPQTHSPAEEGA